MNEIKTDSKELPLKYVYPSINFIGSGPEIKSLGYIAFQAIRIEEEIIIPKDNYINSDYINDIYIKIIKRDKYANFTKPEPIRYVDFKKRYITDKDLIEFDNTTNLCLPLVFNYRNENGIIKEEIESNRIKTINITISYKLLHNS